MWISFCQASLADFARTEIGGVIMKKILLAALASAAIAAAVDTAPAVAADMVVRKAPVAAAAPWSPWMIRLRALVVEPNDSVTFDQLPGTSADWNTTVVPELDITYFFTPNFAAELVLGVTRHHATGNGIATGGVPGANLNGLNVGKSWLLPPTLTFQYHFTDFGAFKPYIGAGVNYTMFFGQKAGNTPNNGLTVTHLDFENTFGLAAQAGFDYMIDRHWGLNFDVKKLYLRPDFNATVNNTIALTGTAKLDPWLIGGGLTYRF